MHQRGYSVISKYISRKSIHSCIKHSFPNKQLKFKFSQQSPPTQPTAQQIKTAQKYVTEQFKSKSWSSFVFSSYFPTKVRTPYAAINMFDLELIKIVENAREPSLALGKMEFWRNSIHKIYSRQTIDKQPISICLNEACQNNPLTKGYFLRLIDARVQEINNRHIETIGDMFRMAQNAKGTILALNLQLLRVEIQSKQMQQIIGSLGRAIGLCEYLKRVPYGLRNNRFFLPSDILIKYNLRPKTIWDRTRGKPCEELFDAVLQIAAYGKKAFQKSIQIYEANKQNIPNHAFRALLKGVQTEMYLLDLQKNNFDIFSRAMNKNHPFKLPYKTFYAAKEKKFYSGDILKH